MDESGTPQYDERPAGQDAPVNRLLPPRTPPRVPNSPVPAAHSNPVRTPLRPTRTVLDRPGRPGSRRTWPRRPWRWARASASPGSSLSPRPASLSSDIPSPAKSVSVFTEDDDGTGQDNESNIFVSTVPGLVHVISAGKAVGIGLVLTPSGKVLTTYQPSGGAGVPQREIRAVWQDVQGHRPRHGPLRGPGAAPDAGRQQPGLLHRGGRELRYPRRQHVRGQAALLSHPRRGLRHGRRHHRHEKRGDHRHRPADRPEPDRQGGRQDPDRAHAVTPAVRVRQRDRRSRW